MAEQEEFILCVTTDGLGTRASAYDFPVKGRGGQGLNVMDLKRGKGREDARLVAAFPVEAGDQLMLVTNGGKLIRISTSDVRIMGRNTQGVRLVKLGDDDMEQVVSVAPVAEKDLGANPGIAEDGGD